MKNVCPVHKKTLPGMRRFVFTNPSMTKLS
jgi:hypothetical protein